MLRTGDGSHPYSKEHGHGHDEHSDNPVWGWDDKDMTDEHKRLVEFINKKDE